MWPLAICNEMWKDVPVEDVFRRAARMGYDGVEIAPFTLAESADQVPQGRRREIAKAAADCGIKMPALHWLFVGPPGLHLTSPDAAVRRRSADYLAALVDLCADLGGGILVHGSPKQRSFSPPDTYEDTFARAAEVFGSVVPRLRERKVTLCVEALAPAETNFVNTAEQAAQLAAAVGAPDAVDIMLDVKAMGHMPDGIVKTLERFGGRARHLHANTPAGKGPGMDDLDFVPILRAAKEVGYGGWVSAEPFDYKPDPDAVARKIIETLGAAKRTVLSP